MTPTSRRQLLLLGAGVVVAPRLAFAQAARRPRRIAFLSLASLNDPRIASFRKGLEETGYAEGKSIVVEWRSADGEAERLPALARELVSAKPDIIVAAQTQAISAVKRATTTIPIVFVATPDPVSSGFVNSLAHPGGNLTGLSSIAADIGSKQMEFLKLALPRCRSVAFLANPTNNASVVVRRMVSGAAENLKLKVISVDAQDLAEIEQGLVSARKSGADAAVFAVDGFFVQVRAQIAALALKHKLPTIFTQREHVDAGGFLSYGPSLSDQYRRAAFYVDRIFKGAKAAELPVEQPSVFELAVNRRTAQHLGLAIPDAILSRANVILD